MDMMNLFKRLGQDRSGHIAIIFALCIIPVVSIAGFAIDFSLLSSNKNKVQRAVDASVLAGARAMQAGKTQQEIRNVMYDYMRGQSQTSSNNGYNCYSMNVQFPQGSQDIAASITCEQSATLMQVVGKDKLKFGVSSTSTWGIGKLDVAFMFDVSGSMSWKPPGAGSGDPNRITSLKAAALQAVDTLKPANGDAATEDVRIAMVSYDSNVNAGDYFEEVTGLAKTRTYNAIDKYVEWEDIETTSIERQYACEERRYCKKFYKKGQKKGQCKPNGWRTEQINCSWKDVEVTEVVPTAVDKERVVTKTITSTCVWERDGDHAFDDKAPVQPADFVNQIDDAHQVIYNVSEEENNPNGYLAAGYAYFQDKSDTNEGSNNDWKTSGITCSNHKPIGLTKNRSTLTTYINNLTANGGTAGHQGIAWAWYLVSENWSNVFTGDATPLPFNEPDSVKAVILMTDGSFLNEEFDAQGDSDEQARLICDKMKQQDKVIIYTVAFGAPDPGKAVLEYCASGPEFAFEPENGDELEQAYQAIATSISDLRVKF